MDRMIRTFISNSHTNIITKFHTYYYCSIAQWNKIFANINRAQFSFVWIIYILLIRIINFNFIRISWINNILNNLISISRFSFFEKCNIVYSFIIYIFSFRFYWAFFFKTFFWIRFYSNRNWDYSLLIWVGLNPNKAAPLITVAWGSFKNMTSELAPSK